ncbi:hypothetical protein H9K76_03385 [Diaphorobacter ruginosibacter]|uniref:Uncharacterized protein n=1 Tax=Diaphorobacter ruginosibacter TaxID=1715720 RepID=A0A7G9RW37_9BURK|nr:hypothetical protein [Diaphorobacter ruginosibacter]QNN59812.1 hypothetical protein H9K76_03385 [Diaphorobacter ruginosibacter]
MGTNADADADADAATGDTLAGIVADTSACAPPLDPRISHAGAHATAMDAYFHRLGVRTTSVVRNPGASEHMIVCFMTYPNSPHRRPFSDSAFIFH